MKILDHSGKFEAKENNNYSKGKSRVQRRGHSHGIFSPPLESPSWYDVIENEADESPSGEIQTSLIKISTVE